VREAPLTHAAAPDQFCKPVSKNCANAENRLEPRTPPRLLALGLVKQTLRVQGVLHEA
jgi:hypothetical protein